MLIHVSLISSKILKSSKPEAVACFSLVDFISSFFIRDTQYFWAVSLEKKPLASCFLRSLKHKCATQWGQSCGSLQTAKAHYNISVTQRACFSVHTGQRLNRIHLSSLRKFYFDNVQDFIIPAVENVRHQCIFLWCSTPTICTCVIWEGQWDAARCSSSVGCMFTWYADSRGFNPYVRQHSFVEIVHGIISTAILSLPLIQKGQLSVTGERVCTKYW